MRVTAFAENTDVLVQGVRRAKWTTILEHLQRRARPLVDIIGVKAKIDAAT